MSDAGTSTRRRHAVVERAAGRVRVRAIETARSAARRFGVDVVRHRPGLPEYVDADAARTLREVRPFTMTADESLFALVESVRYVARNAIAGAFVECGVWRGGSMMAVASTLRQLGVHDRALHLYDTFEGMTAPTDRDVLLHGDATAAQLLAAVDPGDGANVWCVSGLDDVRTALLSTGYPADLLHFVRGPVEQTLPDQAPDEPIAWLRLDTDWYESTRHELDTLVPRMAPGAVLIIDDYWHWAGCRRAVDEFVERTGTKIMFTKVDITAMGVIGAR